MGQCDELLRNMLRNTLRTWGTCGEYIENLGNMLGEHWELGEHVRSTLGTWGTCWEYIGNKTIQKSPLQENVFFAHTTSCGSWQM
jgi:hypothetical protein